MPFITAGSDLPGQRKQAKSRSARKISVSGAHQIIWSSRARKMPEHEQNAVFAGFWQAKLWNRTFRLRSRPDICVLSGSNQMIRRN